jgi:hypothetical protein
MPLSFFIRGKEAPSFKTEEIFRDINCEKMIPVSSYSLEEAILASGDPAMAL